MDDGQSMHHASVRRMWHAALKQLGETPATTERPLSAWHFCDNPQEAGALAALVRAGTKRATAPSRWWFEATGTPLPAPGDLHVVTDWPGRAQCVIQTTRVDVVPFLEVTAEHAAAEGEGDGSLAHWRRTHWNYYQRELAGTVYTPTKDMLIVCERFAVVYGAARGASSLAPRAHFSHSSPTPHTP